MKFLSLKNLLRISGLVFVMMLSAGSVSAQPVDTRPTTTIDRDTGVVRTDRDHNDWGWIGLLGLIGLAGLIPKKRVCDQDRSDTGNRTINR